MYPLHNNIKIKLKAGYFKKKVYCVAKLDHKMCTCEKVIADKCLIRIKRDGTEI
jgi:hypothetical protein